MARIAIVLNASWNIYNFRLPLLKHLSDAGHEIVAIAPEDEYTSRIPYEFHPIRIKSRSLNPLQHAAVLVRFIKVFRKVKPEIALLYTIQPNTHGNIAARLTGVKTISNIAGLGNLYIDRRMATRVATALYKLALRHPHKVFFQNNEDMEMFVKRGLVAEEKAERIPGSGVDIERFSPVERSDHSESHPFVFLLATRLLWEKGIAEYAEAARQLKKQHDDVIFRVAGPLDADNPSALTAADMQAITAASPLEYVGMSDQMEALIGSADCLVLPTYYREGTPRVLLEAAATGKPIITTRAPGCMDVVDDGLNGLLCEPGDARDLTDKMLAMYELSQERRQAMGERGREKAIREFDQKYVLKSYGAVIATMLSEMKT